MLFSFSYFMPHSMMRKSSEIYMHYKPYYYSMDSEMTKKFEIVKQKLEDKSLSTF